MILVIRAVRRLPSHWDVAIAVQLPSAPSASSARVLTAFILSGLLFMLVPGTFLGVLNLVQVASRESVGLVSSAWIQAHGHAQVFGWIGSFILGIGFHSLGQARMTSSSRAVIGWLCWTMWTVGVALRWAANIYEWRWRLLVPVSAMLELAAFVIFVASVSQHRAPSGTTKRLDLWIRFAIYAVAGFGGTLLMNLLTTLSVAWRGESPALPHVVDQQFLILAAWGFLAPFVWAFSSKWLPVFVGLAPVRPRPLVLALAINGIGVVAALCGFTAPAAWSFLAATVLVVQGIRIFEPAIGPAKCRGVHPSFPCFIRLAYGWLVIAALLGVSATRWDVSGGIWGASRHAFTVGFVSTMVFSIGQRVLPAFTGHSTVWSPRLMFAGLLLLTLGCSLRVSAEVLAYQHYSGWAWSVLPTSAVIELAAVSAFALNLLVTLLDGASQPRLVGVATLS